MLTNDFIGELSRRLRDVNERQWNRSFLIKATNSAFVALCNAVPESSTVEETLDLVEGTRQSIGTELYRIVDFLYNVNTDLTVGTPITLADRGAMDTGAPTWRSDAARTYVKHWLPSELEDSGFDVWPQVPNGGLKVRGVFTKVPEITGVETTEVIPFNRFYLEVLFNYALYHCYAIDDDMTANSGRAQRHMYNALAILNKTDESSVKVDSATMETDR